MKNKLSDLNNHLFAAIERLNEETFNAETVKAEIARAKAISDTGRTIIENGRLMLDAAELNLTYRNQELALPDLLQGPKD